MAEALRPWPDVWKDIKGLRPSILNDCDLTPNDDGWVTIHCPLHEDETPSLRVNIEDGGTKCMSRNCDVGHLRNLEDLILDTANKRIRGKRPKDLLGDLGERRMLDPAFLVKDFNISEANGGDIIPIDEPEADPQTEIACRTWCTI